MTEIKAYIRREKFNDVAQALREAGAHNLTVVPVVPVGVDAPLEFVDISTATPTEHFRQIVKIELVCRDAECHRYVELIRQHARTGGQGDGIVFLSAIDDARRIRTDARGDAAL